MTVEFTPQTDFTLPIGVFVERVLGDAIAPQLKEESAQVQALMVVLSKHMLVPDGLSGAEAVKYKSDQLFRQIHKDPITLKQELEDIVPAEHHLEAEIEQARNLVNQGQGIPHVPPFGAILAKRIPRDTVNHCLTLQAGLRIMAMAKQWDGFERIVPARLFDNDPPVLNTAQAALNHTHMHTVARIKDGHAIENHMQEPLTLAYDLGRDVVLYAKDNLHAQGFQHVLHDDPQFVGHTTEQSLIQRAHILQDLLSPPPNKPPPPKGPTLQP